MDYYAVLGLRRDCSQEDVINAYRTLARVEHPSQSKKSKDEALQRFRDLAEAYEVLVDARTRAIFDQHGEKGLKAGVEGRGGVRVPGWVFTKSPEQVFSGFFGSSNAFADDGLFIQPTAAEESKRVVEPEVHNLYCSLEELYSGCKRVQKVSRQRVQADGRTVASEEAVLTVDIRPGWKAGTRITFKGEGDQEVPGEKPGDIVLEVKERPHPHYTRKGNNLHYRAAVTLGQALTGCVVSVPHLDGRVLPIAVGEIVRPGSTQVVPGEGMPSAKDPSRRGDLVLEFEITFPDDLSHAQKEKLKSILP